MRALLTLLGRRWQLPAAFAAGVAAGAGGLSAMPEEQPSVLILSAPCNGKVWTREELNRAPATAFPIPARCIDPELLATAGIVLQR